MYYEKNNKHSLMYKHYIASIEGGYFDSFIKNFYALLESENRTQDFLKVFDDFVTQQPITYFVNQYRTQEQVNEDLMEKIVRNKKYGIKKLNIHGIGEQNIKKIKEFIKLIENSQDVKIGLRTEQDNRMSLSLELI
jgi:hypothetical protein